MDAHATGATTKVGTLCRPNYREALPTRSVQLDKMRILGITQQEDLPMTVSNANSDTPLGFLTVVEDGTHGLFGGYLVLNKAGRPLEFHCTTPVRPNRAQEILYGPTLRPYLYGEQIGRTLLEKGKHEAALVLTDCEPMVTVSEFVASPVALVGGDGSVAKPAKQRTWRVDGAHTSAPSFHFFDVCGQRLALPGDRGEDEQRFIVERIEAIAATLDLCEPFERIRAAIDEARRGGQ